MAIKSVQVLINGITTNLKLNENTGLYEGNVTAPAKSSYNFNQDHYYPVTVSASDDAGNKTSVDDADPDMGEDLRLIVKEKTKPIIAVTKPTDDALITENNPTISWKVTDDDSGVRKESIGIIIDSGDKITNGIIKTEITGGYQCSYTSPSTLSDGSHTFKFDASDNDGNIAIQKTLNITIDTSPPTLQIISPENNLVTNKEVITLSGVTNDEMSDPVTLKYILNDGQEVAVDVLEDGTFNQEIKIKNGTNTLVIISTDRAGKSTSIARIVILDTSAPVISNVILSPNPAATGSVLNISVKVIDN